MGVYQVEIGPIQLRVCRAPFDFCKTHARVLIDHVDDLGFLYFYQYQYIRLN